MARLEEQLEAIRKEAYGAGYAAAMQGIRQFGWRSVHSRSCCREETAEVRHRGETAATPLCGNDPEATVHNRSKAKV